MRERGKRECVDAVVVSSALTRKSAGITQHTDDDIGMLPEHPI